MSDEVLESIRKARDEYRETGKFPVLPDGPIGGPDGIRDDLWVVVFHDEFPEVAKELQVEISRRQSLESIERFLEHRERCRELNADPSKMLDLIGNFANTIMQQAPPEIQERIIRSWLDTWTDAGLRNECVASLQYGIAFHEHFSPEDAVNQRILLEKALTR